MELWWALRPLKSVLRFMQTGAHPDDEISDMLAALALRDGINISYACSTRGEGGQNDIGSEEGRDLGALRTREMERAADVLGMRLYWHSTHPDDTITDFGFSKSGDETLMRWGRDRTVHRFAEIVRAERPDIICPTFLDVPGQHGHHRAMTETAQSVMSAAADPDLRTGLPPWQVKKLYLPAWSGAGRSYDDEVPAPRETLTVLGTDLEPMSGWTWARIGQQSRAFHRTQGMGHWASIGGRRDWPLHLSVSHVEGPDTSLRVGLPGTLSDLADLTGAETIATPLRAAHAATRRAIDAFPDFTAVAAASADALRWLRKARDACPVAVAEEVLHRLETKENQLANVLRLALGIQAWTAIGKRFMEVGETSPMSIEFERGVANVAQIKWDLPCGWEVSGRSLSIDGESAPHEPYRAFYDPCAPDAPRMLASVEIQDLTVDVPLALEPDPVVLPPSRVTLKPGALLVNTSKRKRECEMSVSDLFPKDASLDFDMPDGWHASRSRSGFTLTVPDDVSAGIYGVAARVNDCHANSVRRIDHEHIAPTVCARPANVRVRVLDVAVPTGRIGYVGAGNDRVDHWLAAMGADISRVGDEEFTSESALSAYDAIVVGIFAMRLHPHLANAMPTLHRWVDAGGTLVTLYHRPWDNWIPDRIPPRRLEIGQPSFRWRVTDAYAPVTRIADHPILETPNHIGSEDWDGWVKERGLYFARSWDPAYTPLLSMSDPGEAPLTGSLLVADIGEGRHIHTSLILHHQMEKLVPGAFRLMANFIARRA